MSALILLRISGSVKVLKVLQVLFNMIPRSYTAACTTTTKAAVQQSVIPPGVTMPAGSDIPPLVRPMQLAAGPRSSSMNWPRYHCMNDLVIHATLSNELSACTFWCPAGQRLYSSSATRSDGEDMHGSLKQCNPQQRKSSPLGRPQ